MVKLKSYRIFQFVLMAYLVAAFSWWAILLLKENRELYRIKSDIVYADDPVMQNYLLKDFNRSRTMIIGEGFVFAISILVSFYLVNRAFWTEIKANKKQNNFLLSVTHELKTPIASLRLITQTLKNKSISEEQRKDFMATASEETLRLESLVNNILTAAQMDNNYRFNLEKTNLNELVNLRKERFEKIHPGTRIETEFRTEPLYIRADREAMVKLTDNLIDNALKYAPDGSSVVLSTYKTDKHIVLCVADKGPGIPESEKKKILGKFYRIGNEEERSSKGTGLGLFIVKEICRAHNARIEIDNNTPEGSIFKISFPTDYA